MWRDQLGQPAGRYHGSRLVAELRPDPVDDPVDLAGEAVDEPRPERGLGRLADRRLGRDEVDLDEPGGTLEQGVHRDLDSWRENAAYVFALRRDHVEVRRRPEVHDDARRPVPLEGGDRVRDPVRADLARVVIPERNPSARPRTEDEQRHALPLRELLVRPHQRRHRA